MEPLRIVYNPIAGRGRARRGLEVVRKALTAWSVPFEVLETTHPHHATELVRSLPDDARVVALGGDGTVHEVALGCLGSGRTLCILPQGSGDDFAFALGLDRHELESALRLAVDGDPVWVDTGEVRWNDEDPQAFAPFVNAFGTGFDAEAAANVAAAPPPFTGLGAYLWAVVVTLGRLEHVQATVHVDGRLVHEGPSLLVSVQNGARSGGSFPFSPDAKVDDGLLDILVAGTFGRLGTLAILPRVMRGAHLDHPRIALHHGREVDVVWERPRPGHVEGEPVPASGHFRVRIRPGSLRVVRPPVDSS